MAYWLARMVEAAMGELCVLATENSLY
jgi:hypothetical protein